MTHKQYGTRTKPVTMVKITSGDVTLGRVEPDAFRASVGGPRNAFLQNLVERFNAAKLAAGEPERAEIILR